MKGSSQTTVAASKEQEAEVLDKMFTSDLDLRDTTSFLFEQYRLYVEMADKTSSRRATTNSFYLTANSFLFVAIGVLLSSGLAMVAPLVLIVACFICISWMMLIRYYKGLNSAKYKVINAIEERLPVKGFTAEWKLVKLDTDPVKKYRGLTFVEQWVPVGLLIMYSVALVGLIVVLVLISTKTIPNIFEATLV